VVSFLADWLSFFTLFLAFDSSTRTVVANLAASTLYRAAATAGTEFFSSDCLGS